jgi:hypothetical protein
METPRVTDTAAAAAVAAAVIKFFCRFVCLFLGRGGHFQTFGGASDHILALCKINASFRSTLLELKQSIRHDDTSLGGWECLIIIISLGVPPNRPERRAFATEPGAI